MEISTMVWLSEDESHYSFDRIKQMLTVVPRVRRTQALEPNEDGELVMVSRVEPSKEPIACYKMRDTLGYDQIGLPIDWALMNIPQLEESPPEDRTIKGASITIRKLPDPNHPSAPAGQEDFFNSVNYNTRTNYVCFAQAPTGAGKTVTILNAIGHAKRCSLVSVPNTGLAHQWKLEAIKHLGLLPEEIGIVGAGQHRWEGCSLVIAVINSLVMTELPPEFFISFGFVAFDEAHRLGAHEFSKAMSLFPARYKLAVSATPDRKDGMDEVIFNYFGYPKVVAKAPALETTCWKVNYFIVGNTDWLLRCRNDMRPMKWLAGLQHRNEMLCGLAEDLYLRGRQVILLSRFVNHIETLIAMLTERGIIPASAMGQYTGTMKGKKLGQVYLDKVKANSQMLFATYAKAKEGFDEPRLDAGVELTPVADNVQGIGRVRRELHGKKKPLWFTVCDLNITLFERYTMARLRGFEKNNVIVKTLKGHRL